jgi:hypothetical protein
MTARRLRPPFAAAFAALALLGAACANDYASMTGTLKVT